MFFSKNRDFQIFDIQIDAETAFFTQFFWNLICNPLKCPCRRGRGCGVLEVSLQPKHGADVPIIGIWGFFLFLYFPPFFIKKQNKTCSNMSQKLRVKPLSLSDNLQERLDTLLGRIRRVKRSKMSQPLRGLNQVLSGLSQAPESSRKSSKYQMRDRRTNRSTDRPTRRTNPVTHSL